MCNFAVSVTKPMFHDFFDGACGQLYDNIWLRILASHNCGRLGPAATETLHGSHPWIVFGRQREMAMVAYCGEGWGS
jgi:hypothetical protein